MKPVFTSESLGLLQNYPLWMKVELTKQRVREWYEYHNGEVYVSFSGGKDSTVLLHIVRSIYPDVEAVFSDTGLEYPEIKQFVKGFDNVTIVRPDMSFKQVVEQKGYPIVSKSVSNCVRLAKQNIADGKDTLRVRQIRGLEVGSKFNKGKWEFLLDAPFKISDECCNELKKKPLKKFTKKSNKKPMMATMAAEGGVRKEAYMKTGCNAFENGKSQPMGFWTEQDVFEYILENNLEIAPVYGEIVKDEKGNYTTSKEKRTGCVFCGFGCHIEKSPNRFERMKESHPNLHKYCMETLGMKEVLDYINVKY
jgi:3'-phosphoadenosine 5'-phosphosulfate sulfotransferase (PAPS reductase)/FAD synthetase